MKNDTLFKNRTRVLSRLLEAGYTDETKVLKIELADVPKIANLSMDDLGIIVEMQKSIKSHKFYSYLGGCFDEQNIQKG